jgi:hypothetical protein
MVSRFGQRIAAWLVLCAFASCSTTATMSRNNGPAYEAEILSSDADFLSVRDNYGRQIVVSRDEVIEIDHPGNVLYTIGAVLVAMATPMLVAGVLHSNRSSKSDWSGMELVFGIPVAVTGLCLAIPGWSRYRRSKVAAEAFEDANPILPVPRPVRFPPYPPSQPPH